jgi:hypothetical protein
MKDYLSKPEVNFFLSILIPLVALGVAWGVMTARLDNVDKRVDSLEEINSSQTKINQDIQVRLAEIQKDVLYIRKELDKHAAE